MSLRERADDLRELMDDPSCDPVRLRRTIERFAIVNRLVAGWDAVYRRHIRPALAGAAGPVRVLDVGCGGGDVLRRVVALAREDGHLVDAVGIDPDGRAIEVARAGEASPGLRFRQAYSHDLVAEGEVFDVVVSNHLLHHLGDGERAGLFADTERLAERVAVHSDIHRSRTAYAAYAVAITPLAPGSFLRTDGLRSIRRSHTREELAALVPPGWTVERRGFRVVAVRRPWAGGEVEPGPESAVDGERGA